MAFRDITHAARAVSKRPGFSLAVVLTLALGVGGTTAVFSLLNTVVLRPLPYPESDRLYTLFEQDSTGARQLASYPTFRDWHEQSETFDGLAFVRGTGIAYQLGDRAGQDGVEGEGWVRSRACPSGRVAQCPLR